jgi:hypothetical protein
VEKIDLRRQLKQLYAPSAKAVAEVQVPAFTFLMVDGQGDPNTSGTYWTMMIMQPAFVPQALLHKAIGEVGQKKSLPALPRLRIENFEEGRCAQILHVGPFPEEGPTVDRLHAHIEARTGLRGKHHEIYLTDIRRADPSRWKTVIRQPME